MYSINFSYSTSNNQAVDYKPYNTSLENFANVLKSNGRYSPFIYNENYRKESNTILNKTNCIMLDFDDGLTLEKAKKIFDVYNVIIATTKSHQKEKNGIICDRFRVILPTDYFEDITIEDYKQMMSLLILRYGSDNATKDVARYYYAYSESEVFINNGVNFDIKLLLRQSKMFYKINNQNKQKEKETKKGVNLNMVNKQYDNSCQTKKEWFERFSHKEQILNYFEFDKRWGSAGRNNFLHGVAKHLQEHNCDNEFIKDELLWINNQSGNPLEEIEIIRTIFKSLRL